MSEDITRADRWHETPPVTFEELTIEFFLYHADIAKAKGCVRWATDTDRTEKPWTTKVYFFKEIGT